MNQANKKALLYYFSLTLALVFILYPLPKTFRETRLRDEFEQMHAASALAQKWFQVIDAQSSVTAGGNVNGKTIQYQGLLGLDTSSITTSVGGLDAKKISLNPDWAALIYLWLKQSGVRSGSTVGITVSASFPALNIATLAAVKQFGAVPVLLSSLGSSSYGANNPNITWLDIESWLRQYANADVESRLVTPGGEGDNGTGLSPEGMAAFRAAAARNNQVLFVPESFEQSRLTKINLFDSLNIAMLINVGGNQVAVGKCSHAAALGGGVLTHEYGCTHNNNGLISHYAALGLPVVHLLNIKDIAQKNGVGVRNNYRPYAALYYVIALKKWLIALTLLLYIVFLGIIRWRLKAE